MGRSCSPLYIMFIQDSGSSVWSRFTPAVRGQARDCTSALRWPTPHGQCPSHGQTANFRVVGKCSCALCLKGESELRWEHYCLPQLPCGLNKINFEAVAQCHVESRSSRCCFVMVDNYKRISAYNFILQIAVVAGGWAWCLRCWPGFHSHFPHLLITLLLKSGYSSELLSCGDLMFVHERDESRTCVGRSQTCVVTVVITIIVLLTGPEISYMG